MNTRILTHPTSAAERIATFEARLADAQRQLGEAKTFLDKQIAEAWIAAFENDLMLWRAQQQRGAR